ncbi:hypothetical protein [Desulfoluna spongiiphila]|nr:hypothetical protein [Desulfoluna spongiiphila]
MKINLMLPTVIICLFFQAALMPTMLQASSLEITSHGVAGQGDAEWNHEFYTFAPVFWNNKTIPLDKRISVTRYVLGRLEFERNVFPQLDEKVSISGKSKNIKDIIEMMNGKLNNTLPVVYNCNLAVTHNVKIENYSVYEIIEAVCAGAGYDPIYHKDTLEIRDRH